MSTYLLLRFDAPLMSFGGVLVDRHGVTREFPGASQIVGLIANALGYEHGEFERLERLQQRLVFGTRCDVVGEQVVDYQTVDLGQDFMREGWTTWGWAETRGGASGGSTHIRLRHYLVDAVYTLAVTLDPKDEPPALEAVAVALRWPERPLFIGRKCCLPAEPILLKQCEAASLREALEHAPRPERSNTSILRTSLPTDGGVPADGTKILFVADRRDWANQIHVGRRCVREEALEYPRKENGDGD